MLKIQRIILNWGPIAFLLNKSKHIYLPGFQGLPLYDVLSFYNRQIRKQSLTERAAAISYHFIMSLPPSLLFIFTLIPNLPFISRRNIKIQLHRLIFDIIPAKTYNQGVIEFIDSFIDNNRIGLLSFGVVLSLFFASNAMMGIMRSFNKDYAGFTNRKGLHKRGIAIRLSLVLFGLLLAYIVLLVLQGNVLNFLVKSNWIKTLIQYSRWVFIILLVFFAIGFIFRYAPAVTKRWNFISPGVILTTFLCLLATLGFAFFVNNFARYNALYGSIGTIMMLMALIFINSLALLIGFELNVTINALKSSRTEET